MSFELREPSLDHDISSRSQDLDPRRPTIHHFEDPVLTKRQSIETLSTSSLGFGYGGGVKIRQLDIASPTLRAHLRALARGVRPMTRLRKLGAGLERIELFGKREKIKHEWTLLSVC